MAKLTTGGNARVMRDLPTEAASIQEGDTIRASWRVGGVTFSRAGKVARIIHGRGSRARSFITLDGDEIIHWTPDSRVTFVITNQAPVAQTPMFEIG